MEKKGDFDAKNDSSKILVIGDWIVDEHWVTGTHRSRTRSRPGKAHRRALHGLKSNVMSLAGAGLTASILHQVKWRNQNRDIVGVGLWHPDDTDTLTALLHPSSANEHTPHQITQKYFSQDEAPPLLINLCQESVEPACGTNRVIRLYQKKGSEYDMFDRIDWELEKPSGPRFSKQNIGDDAALNRVADPKNVEAVVIKDLAKGVISEGSISLLVDRFKQKKSIKWFISSKEFRPQWASRLKPVKHCVQLFMIPPVAAQRALAEEDFTSWTTCSSDGTKAPSQKAIEIIDATTREYPNAIVVVLPDDRTALVCGRTGRKKHAEKESPESSEEDASFVLWIDRSERAFPGCPMASVFFAVMIAFLLEDPHLYLGGLLKHSLSFLCEWMSKEAGRVVDPDGWRPDQETCLNLSSFNVDQPTPDRITPVSWQDTQEEWKQALEGHGVILDRPPRLELWRAMHEVAGYICLVPSKRKVLRAIVAELQSFKAAGGSDHHHSCLLIASPGSGKTHLARCLANHLNMGFLEFNIAQMLNLQDILDCFDTIVTTQLQNQGKRLLVFIDEINTELNRQSVYSTFLAPLEKGLYIRAEKAFQIAPCTWVFAGTRDPEEDDANKASDFVSRLTLPPQRLDIGGDEESWARLEKVYQGVSLLRTRFPDVDQVSHKVLATFHLCRPNLEVRKLEQFVKSFFYIQYGKVHSKNVPSRWFKDLGIDQANWNLISEYEKDENERDQPVHIK